MSATRYAVIGNPIEHSRSPEIHRAFARQTGEAIDYERILGQLDGFERQVHEFFAQGGGLNVTVPFKERAFALADELSDRARSAGAVNTLIPLADGRLRGDNTDGVGLVRDLARNHNCLIAGSRILLLGAGGAARGALLPLLESGPEQLVIANRTASKAEHLAQLQEAPSVQLLGIGLDELEGRQFDLIINATAAGLSGQVPDLPEGILAPGGWCYDMMYGREPTAFVRWGLQQEAAQSLDGLGMLVEQAAESFFLWRGVRPDTAPVIAMLRASLARGARG